MLTPKQEIQAELWKAFRFEETHRGGEKIKKGEEHEWKKGEFPYFKDIINPVYEAAIKGGFQVFMPSKDFHRAADIRANDGLGIFGIADSEFIGAELLTASKLYTSLPRRKLVFNSVSQFYAPKGTPVFSPKNGFSYRDSVGIDTRSEVYESTIVQRLETWSKENWTKIGITIMPKGSWDAVELTFSVDPRKKYRKGNPYTILEVLPSRKRTCPLPGCWARFTPTIYIALKTCSRRMFIS